MTALRLQIGLDAASQATVKALAEKNDLGFHSQYITDDVMHLYASGVITNRKKGLNDGKLVASCAIGSPNLYEFLHDNPGVDFRPSDYVNDPFIIAQHNRMISMNVAHTIDLTGQTAAEASEHTFFAGVSGIPDFVRGAKRSKGGKVHPHALFHLAGREAQQYRSGFEWPCRGGAPGRRALCGHRIRCRQPVPVKAFRSGCWP
jgi:acyl-CoA hydrolase